MLTILKSGLFLLPWILSSGLSWGQGPLMTIEDCYALAKQNYPLVAEHQLIARSRDYTIENLAKKNLPQLSVQGSATYQSEVTRIPIHIPDVNVPTLSKDQYRLYGEATQNLYDGGLVKTQKQFQETQAKMEDQQLDIQLYQLKSRINQLFFGILLIDQQLKQNELLKSDIAMGIKKVRAAIDNGAALKSNADILKAQLLETDQRTTELQASRNAYSKMLGMFIHRPLNDSLELAVPTPETQDLQIRRPELGLFKYQHDLLDIQDKMLTAETLPKFSLFLQGGMGRPALDMLNNDFKAYYVGGVQMTVPISGFYMMKRKRALITLSHQKLAAEQETFLFNTNLDLQEQDTQITKLERLLQSDDQIISLRNDIKATALAQLQQGVINGNDYVRDANAEDIARQNKVFHQVQLLLMQYNQKVTTGN